MSINGSAYTIKYRATIATPITAIQIKAGTSKGFWITEVHATQTGLTTESRPEISIVRKTAAATVTTAVVGTHIFFHDPNDASAQLNLSLGTAATGVNATAEGTDGDSPYTEGFSVLAGFHYVPLPESRIWVPTNGIVGIKFITAPSSATWTVGVTIIED